ncbi:MAG: hypothetical protein EZS28_042771 [Streblomastix strix]|uniref:Uncharacterized protein n=1 Tax=Streblomastix strix TaxID=222440 RepID=A0A5J4TUX8_9EUKA|nr:MAG: hypothetical protein EZS28_042771 [Streblomastix strix]
MLQKTNNGPSEGIITHSEASNIVAPIEKMSEDVIVNVCVSTSGARYLESPSEIGDVKSLKYEIFQSLQV